MTADIRLGRWQDVLADVTCDALICDPPYSARTHEGHDDSAAEHRGAHPRKGGPDWEERWQQNGGRRRSINYAAWTADDVRGFVSSWAPRVGGWMVFFTSHDLAPVFSSSLEEEGRYVFSPLPFFSPGSRVRLSGDGPSSWTCWIVVARPRCAPYAKWGTLPGGYVHPPEACEVVGGKPLGLMRAIVRDYSRPGDLVCDPFLGSGTTAIAALSEGRRFVGSEEKPEHMDIIRRRLARGHTVDFFAGGIG
jgi:site-specific DNA-methyltransferase (adenine-specific)